MSNNDKKEILEAFNKHFCEFVEDVYRVFPTDSVISVLNKSVSVYMMVYKKSVIQIFKRDIVDRYLNEIEKGDLTFFIDKNYQEDVSNGDFKNNADFIMNKIDYIKTLVLKMSKDEQENIMKYFQNLTTICNLYYEE
jgi:hypothetical protein